jgi:very-short-patch-repair endonuclease
MREKVARAAPAKLSCFVICRPCLKPRPLSVERVLPISFDEDGKMEVDFLCAEAGLVIELDGAQHLNDVDAYRRDRRNDALLQQNGYLVLRFLTDDAGKRLDQVLDSTLAALVHLKSRRHSGR